MLLLGIMIVLYLEETVYTLSLLTQVYHKENVQIYFVWPMLETTFFISLASPRFPVFHVHSISTIGKVFQISPERLPQAVCPKIFWFTVYCWLTRILLCLYR